MDQPKTSGRLVRGRDDSAISLFAGRVDYAKTPTGAGDLPGVTN